MPVYENTYRMWEGKRRSLFHRLLAFPKFTYLQIKGKRLIHTVFVMSWLPFILFTVYIYARVNVRLVQSLRIPIQSVPAVDARFFLTFILAQLPFLFFFTLMVGPGLISTDLRHQALPMILSKPIGRWEYLLGKFNPFVVSGVTFIYLTDSGGSCGKPVATEVLESISVGFAEDCHFLICYYLHAEPFGADVFQFDQQYTICQCSSDYVHHRQPDRGGNCERDFSFRAMDGVFAAHLGGKCGVQSLRCEKHYRCPCRERVGVFNLPVGWMCCNPRLTREGIPTPSGVAQHSIKSLLCFRLSQKDEKNPLITLMNANIYWRKFADIRGFIFGAVGNEIKRPQKVSMSRGDDNQNANN